MSEMVFDIEADGLLDEATQIHCISISEDGGEPHCYYPDKVEDAIHRLKSASKLIGHNIIGYDLPLLKKLYGFVPSAHSEIRDTLVIAQMVLPDMYTKDSDAEKIPKKYWGRYSLRSFGYRFGKQKGEVEEFGEFTLEMGDYCNQDVRITEQLWRLCISKGTSVQSVDLEMAFATLAHRMQEVGIGFNVKEAEDVLEELLGERYELLSEVSHLVPPTVEELRTPQYWTDPITDVQYTRKSDAPASVRKELVRGPNKVKEHLFNPMSRQQVAAYLQSRGWEPQATTPTGKPKVDETILKGITDIPEAGMIARLYQSQKILAMLYDGKEGWLKLVDDTGRLHPRLKTVGTVSGRTSCVSPNLQQVPSARLPWGKECRQLFYAPEGRKLCGVDAKSLEVRCFAHYLSRYDGGEFSTEVLSGDIHQSNATMMGCSRSVAKNTFFALLYGASAQKIASMLDYTTAEARDLVDELYRKRPAMKKFMNDVQRRALSTGFLKGIDGRKLYPRSPHSSVNLLVQAAGACVSKQAAVNTANDIDEHWSDYDINLVGFIHDEIIVEVPEDVAEAITQLAITGQLSLRCPMVGDGCVGDTWYEVH